MLSAGLLLRVLYAAGFLFVVAVAVTGLPYYMLPLAERPHSAMHTQLKPAGLWGHGLGIIGTFMLIVLLAYSVRKRLGARRGLGSLRRWLDVHIFLGVMGPLLITLHTAMKFSGIVSISFFSMMAVALSGVFGRYVYMQIPRDSRGHALGLAAAQKRMEELGERLRSQYRLPDEAIRSFVQHTGVSDGAARSKIGSFFHSIGRDITLRGRMRRLRRRLKKAGTDLPAAVINEVIGLARESSVLQRRIAQLDSMNELFHYWHVFHKPFAIVMYIIMVVHVGVTVAFGYRWIF
jgi:hypothetical protein